MKKILTLAFLLIAGSATAQDLLVLRNGDVESVKVLEVSDTEIKYKKWDNSDGPSFVTSIDNVFSIKYENGTQQSFNTHAQGKATSYSYRRKPNKGFSVHLGAAFPTGYFADEDNFPQGGAGTGFALGLKKTWALPQNGLGLFLGVDFIYNGANSELKDIFDEADESKIPHNINIPVLIGLNYNCDLDSDLSLWFEAGIGPNFRMISKAEMSIYDYSYNSTIKESYKMSTSVALQLGCGFMIKDKVSLGLHYYSLGKAKLEYEYEEEEYSYNSVTYKGSYTGEPVNVFMIRLGYNF